MVAAHIGEILVVTGLLTMGAIIAFPVPATVLTLEFGVAAPDFGVTDHKRGTGVLLVLAGALPVFARDHPEVRVPVMVVAATREVEDSGSRMTGSLRRRPLSVMIAPADAMMAIVYLIALS